MPCHGRGAGFPEAGCVGGPWLGIAWWNRRPCPELSGYALVLEAHPVHEAQHWRLCSAPWLSASPGFMRCTLLLCQSLSEKEDTCLSHLPKVTQQVESRLEL